MAIITVSDLNPVGFDLFSDSESYMVALSEDELGMQGGAWWSSVTVTATSSPVCVSVSIVSATLVGSYLYGRFHG